MRPQPRRALRIGVLCGILALIGACTTIERQEAESDEDLLSAAGFSMLVADTPAKQAQLQAMKQRKILRREKDGQLNFLYADAEFCKCLFVGTEKEYQQFQRLALRRENAIARQEAALDADEAGMYDWGMWGYPGW
jgi:hypothetical protein